MDYYASWPRWQMPKWVGATLGGAFTLVVIVCVALIVDLTRQPRPRAVAPTPVAKTIAPTPPVVVAPTAATVASIPPPKASQPAAVKSAPTTHKKRTIVAKHDAKPKRGASDIDRLLGL